MSQSLVPSCVARLWKRDPLPAGRLDRAEGGAFSVLDIIFAGLVGVLLLVRFVDITRLNGLTAEGEPASLAHWRRYAAMLLVASTLLWLLAHAGGRLL